MKTKTKLKLKSILKTKTETKKINQNENHTATQQIMQMTTWHKNRPFWNIFLSQSFSIYGRN